MGKRIMSLNHIYKYFKRYKMLLFYEIMINIKEIYNKNKIYIISLHYKIIFE